MDLVVARAIRSQGVLRRGVLRAHGVTCRTVDARLASGEWRVVLGDVILLASTFPSVEARVQAVRLLAPVHRFVGDVASAAWSLMDEREVCDVVAEVRRGTRAQRGDGVRLVRADVSLAEIRAAPVVKGLRVTDEAATLRMHVAQLPSRDADELVSAYLRRHRNDSTALWSTCGRGRLGSAALRASLERVDDGHWSPPERTLGQALKRRGAELVPNFEVVRPSTGERAVIDLYDAGTRRGVDVDGWTYHVDPARFAGDRRRDLWLETECNIRILRVAAADVARHEDRTADAVLRWLAS